MKKQIAVLMAAATAVTTVAPAIANAAVTEHTNVSVDELKSKIKEALDKKFANPTGEGLKVTDKFDIAKEVEEYKKSQYLVVLSTDLKLVDLEGSGLVSDDTNGYKEFIKLAGVKTLGKDYVVTDAEKVAKAIEKIRIEGNSLAVSIVDKGVSSDGRPTEVTEAKIIGRGEEDTQDIKSIVERLALGIKDGYKSGFIKSLVIDGENYSAGKKKDYNKVENIDVTFTSGKTASLSIGYKGVDLDTFMAGDKEVTVFGDMGSNKYEIKPELEQTTLDTVTGFKELKMGDGKKQEIDVPRGNTEVYVLADDVLAKEIKVESVYSKDGGYTEEGTVFANKLIKASTQGNRMAVFSHDGATYQVNSDQLKRDIYGAKIVSRDGKYALEITTDVKDTKDKYRNLKLKMILTGVNPDDLQVLRTDLYNGREVVAGKFKKLVGMNRYETAVEVSKATFKDATANSIVIVGGHSVIDGLSAAPLASSAMAPILLADKNGLSDKTMSEIERACGKDKMAGKKLYIVGGENSVPMSAENQIRGKFPNTEIVRLSGANRYETSMMVAKELKSGYKADSKIFAVGGNGAADAMSVAPVAANKDQKYFVRKVNPILVVPKDGISMDTREKLGEAGIKDIVAVGGVASISEQSMKDLRAIKSNPKVTRISGSNRYDTNLEILKKYYANEIEVKGIIVASGATDKLVDAQTASALASVYGETAPIMLAGDKLTSGQEKFLKDKKNYIMSNVYQVGGVVSADFMKAVVKTLGL